MKTNLLGTTLAALCIIIFVPIASAQVAPMYSVTDLGTLGGNSSLAIGISGSGQIVVPVDSMGIPKGSAAARHNKWSVTANESPARYWIA